MGKQELTDASLSLPPGLPTRPQANRKNIEEVLELVRVGRLRPLVSRTYPVGEYHDAFTAMMTRQVLGKVNIQLGPDVPEKAKL